MKNYCIALVICMIPFTRETGYSQVSGGDTGGEPTGEKGSPILKIFANVHTGLTGADMSRAFEVRRAYFGYRYRFDENWRTEIKLDLGAPEEISEFARLRRYAYFKTAAVFYDQNKWSVYAGIIDTEHYKLQEKYWKHRYIYKSMQDEHRFGPKADLGATLIFHAAEFLDLDASVMNGEGYTDIQSDNSFKVSAGVSYYPIRRVLLRIYADAIEKDEVQSGTLSTFAGYRYESITAGTEYNWKLNRDFLKDHNQQGVSLYLSYDLNEKFELFGRYDWLNSNIPAEYSQPWNLQEDGTALIFGIRYMPIKHIKMALNYQDWVPYAANLSNLRYLFLNLEIVL